MDLNGPSMRRVARVEFRDLEVFVAVVKSGSFTEAARQAFVSQPAVSLAVRRLEEELGTRLLDRSRRQVRPTGSGEVLFEHATALLRGRDAVRWEIGRWTGLEGGVLRLGTTDAVSVYLLPDTYRAFRRRYPRVALRVSVDSSSVLSGALASGELDLAVLTLPAPRGDLETTPLEEERLVPVCARTHPLVASRGRRVPPDALTDEAMIAYPSGSVTRSAIDAALTEVGATPAVDMEMGNPEAMKRLVEVGIGFSVLPERLVREEIRRGRLVVLQIPRFRATRTLGFAHTRGSTIPPAAQAFMDLTRERFAARAKRTTTGRSARPRSRPARRSSS